MTNQTKNEIIKALAYGETQDQIAQDEGIGIPAVQEVQQSCAAEIAEERDMLKGAGYIE